jgi:hypothetical protein
MVNSPKLLPPPHGPMATTSSPAVRACTGRQTSGGEGDWAHPGVIAGGSSAGAVACERWRRHQGSTAVAARSPARGKARLSNARRTRLQCDLEEILWGPKDVESRRKYKFGKACPTAAAEVRTPASWGFGLSNK